MLISLALKNIFSRKSSIIIIVFITLVFTLLFLVNNFFDETEKGISQTYTDSFTGDFIIRPVSKSPISLLGDDTPLTGELTKLDILPQYLDIKEILETNAKVKNTVNQLTDIARFQTNDFELDSFVFGIDGRDYTAVLSGVEILEGEAFSEDEKGIMLSSKIAKDAKVGVGDFIEIIMVEGMSVSIRSLPVTAIYDYPMYTEVLNHIVLVNADSLRELKNISNTQFIEDSAIQSENTKLLDSGSYFDSLDDLFNDLFFDASFVDAIYNDDALFIENTEEIKAENTAWNFIIGKVKDGQSISQTIRQLNSSFKKASIPVEAVNWRSAAGATASYLYFLRLILNIGVIIILLSGFIIINNTLSIHVIDRTQEIGSMRAIGAKKSFIALLFLSETFLLTLISSFFAILLGLFLQTIINHFAFSLRNEFIIQLIGSSTLYITSSFKSVFVLVLASLGLTFISWLSPVKTALAVSPLAAMRESQ